MDEMQAMDTEFEDEDDEVRSHVYAYGLKFLHKRL